MSAKALPAAALAEDRRAAVALLERHAPDLVSRETWHRLDAVVALLLRWQPAVNLVSASSLAKLWTRHVADSLQLFPLAPEARTWVDLGSGGGFPGLVLACAMAELDGARVHLIESDQRKAAFLREAARTAAVPATVHAQRIETVASTWAGRADVISARALAPLSRLLDHAEPWLQSGAQALFLKGQDVERELTESSKSWHMDVELLASITDPLGRIVHVRRAERR